MIDSPSSTGYSNGMNFQQLSSTQPCSPFVTMITHPRCFAASNVRRAPLAASCNFAICSWVSVKESSKLSPCCLTQVLGSSVSSQSKIIKVSSAEKTFFVVTLSSGGSALSTGSLLESSLPISVDRSDRASSADGCNCGVFSWFSLSTCLQAASASQTFFSRLQATSSSQTSCNFWTSAQSSCSQAWASSNSLPTRQAWLSQASWCCSN
mmetsp:Transcript_25174/g.49325  ORF Transcript_25174/g.49325 Transcript_25174/m.49325 type:complete len:209 (+) Transcript_25174:393-1019(+)